MRYLYLCSQHFNLILNVLNLEIIVKPLYITVDLTMINCIRVMHNMLPTLENFAFNIYLISNFGAPGKLYINTAKSRTLSFRSSISH